MWQRRALRAVACVLINVAPVVSQQATSVPAALRSAVPILCTENHGAARTRVRGTGIIADSGGTLLTAAHVIQQAHSDCTLSVMVPDDDWIRAGRLSAFLIKDCQLYQPLDVAVCRVRPAGSSRDWAFLRGGFVRLRDPRPGEFVSVTAFAGWGLAPITRAGHVQAHRNFRRQDGCYCDFATDITAEEGMSGSPIISASGEVLGILTLAGTGKFRGVSFGTSFAEAAPFLRTQGVMLSTDFAGLPPKSARPR